MHNAPPNTPDALQLQPTLCALCDTNANDRELYPVSFNVEDLNQPVFSARRLPDRVHYRMVRCTRCGLVRSDPILDAIALAQLYTKSHFTYEAQTTFTAATYLDYFERMLPYLPKDVAVLEIGCGNGFFLQQLQQKRRVVVYGVEPSSEALAQAPNALRAQLQAGVFAPGLFPPASMDVICAFQTFDHVPEPNAFLQTVQATLKPNSHALFINHDIGSFLARAMGRACPMIDIEHTYLYDRRTFRHIFERNGFSAVRVFGVANTYPLRYWLHLLPLPARPKAALLQAAQHARWGNFPIRINAGNMGILARKI